MSYQRKCRWHGFGYKNKKGENMLVCDRTGEQVKHSYCVNRCDDYSPLTRKKDGKDGVSNDT